MTVTATATTTSTKYKSEIMFQLAEERTLPDSLPLICHWKPNHGSLSLQASGTKCLLVFVSVFHFITFVIVIRDKMHMCRNACLPLAPLRQTKGHKCQVIIITEKTNQESWTQKSRRKGLILSSQREKRGKREPPARSQTFDHQIPNNKNQGIPQHSLFRLSP